MTLTRHTQGTKLQRGDGGGTEVFTTIAEVINFTGPTETAAQREVTNFDSTAKEYIAGLRDAGEISFDMNFVGQDAQQQGLRTDMIDRVTRNFKLILNDNTVEADKTTIAFAAVVTSFSISGETDGNYRSSVSLKITGTPTITYSDGT